ncbi:MAG: 23S rRNA (adenine(2503)-C(2))-methyltransferase RlmN [Eubacteriales bacterium]|nr:23S rRNA (adenine(2503)-C(2))-methyltransferase RlmN [Clostridiales bacterium]MDD7231430.1 23S rRNA (adenine(2503)-C(2))-methyltransferase RlmN [Clostridiales bacterium]MDY2720908.1 23S rRNA (adenine(2503)-C(2))-methyltransferase RlmN [Eubacteriales bacterium]MDY5688747.1 23S rRNA (adenine(2503)-C(2))-methyltransferase RlmN [Eubacteriales bacterium]
MKKNSKDVVTYTEDEIRSDPYGFTLKEITEVLGEQEAQKLFNELYKKKPISKYQTVKIKEIQQGGDTSKYAFELTDGYCIETVCIKRKTGTTVCVSTMVGCPVGCIFCESGSNGFIRNLTPSEIVQQVVLLKEKVNRIVYMGMGEPLFNYNSLIKSIHILRDRNGYNFPTDGITVSTVGPLTQLKKLREEHLKIQLTLSLHATNQTTRNKVIPHMSGNKIEEVVEAVLSYSERHNRKITIAYLLLPGVNDSISDVRQLSRWFRGKNVLINLLQYNNTKCFDMKSPNKQQLVAFKNLLEREGLEVKLRESRGGKIKAACGQLVSEHNKKGARTTQSTVRSNSETIQNKKAIQYDTSTKTDLRQNSSRTKRQDSKNGNFKSKKTRRSPHNA